MVYERSSTFPHGGDWVTYGESYGGEILDFSANVSPLGLPASVKEAICSSLETASRYPDPECRRLRRAIADKYGLSCEDILCGNGAADLIYRLAYAAWPGKALVPAPDFQEYEAALRQVGCEVVYWEWMGGMAAQEAELEQAAGRLDLLGGSFGREAEPEAKSGQESGRLDLIGGFLEGGADQKPKLRQLTRMPDLPATMLEDGLEMVILSNPNNPSGLIYSRDSLEKLLMQCEERNILLVADECFMDFVESRERCTLLSLVERYRCLCVLRAFTKFYGMAGLRLGWCATSNRDLIERMGKAGPPWSVSMPAQEAGVAALRDEGYEACLRELISEERCRMQGRLRDMGFFVLPGEANYVLFHAGQADLACRLMERGFAIRDCSNYRGLGKGWFRAAVRLREENEALMEAVRQVFAERFSI
ncbi:MAG: pyridoxal phosphate-dependent class II aminotransferase [Lachnospiraceae bacterium]|nr:pyridoxal phosphate-dependent class II aminotransferase [Lachnospiraceae bacterium]